MLLHFTRAGEAFGPYPLEEAREYLKKGQILPTDQAWYEGAPGWMNVTEVPGVIRDGRIDRINKFLPEQPSLWSVVGDDRTSNGLVVELMDVESFVQIDQEVRLGLLDE